MADLHTVNTEIAPTHSGGTQPASFGRRTPFAGMDDGQLIDHYLRERCGQSDHTKESYRTQLRRLDYYCARAGLPGFRGFTRDHWVLFEKYLQAPPAEDIMQRSAPLGSPDWRPFRRPLKESSVALAQTIAKGFFEWLADPAIGVLETNPVASIKSRRSRKSATVAGVERLLPIEARRFVDTAIECLYEQTVDAAGRDVSEERARMRARARWVIDLALLTGLRASEIASASSDMIKPGRSGGYVLKIVRKGGKESSLPLLPEVIDGYLRYLQAYGLTWQRTIALPLIMPARLGGSPIINGQYALASCSRSQVWRIVKAVMLRAAQEAQSAGDEAAADKLKDASTHWLRHSFATDLLDAGADLRGTRDLLDHSSLTTTSIYAHRPEQGLRADLGKLSEYRQKEKPGASE